MTRRALPGLFALCTLVSSSVMAQTLTAELLNGRRVQADPQELLSGDGLRGPALDEVAQIAWAATRALAVTSGAETQCVSLGADLDASLPSDWAQEGATLAWQPAQGPRIFHQWRHIPGAQWVWTTGEWFGQDHRERAIFHQGFEIPSGLDVVRATLLLGVDEGLEQIRLNGIALPLPAPAQRFDTWDVTPAVCSGVNLLALVAVDRPESDAEAQSVGLNAAGVAFRLDILAVPADPSAERREAPNCVAHLINGDRLSGRLAEIDDSQVHLETELGAVAVDRDWVVDLLVSLPEPPSGIGPFRREASPPEPIIAPLPRTVPDWAPGVLLEDGTHLSGRILSTDRRRLLVKPRYSDAVPVDLDTVQAICMNGPGDELSTADGGEAVDPRLCRALTVDGDQVSGLLLSAGDVVEIDSPGLGVVQIPRARLVRASFPLSGALNARRRIDLAAASVPRRLEVWGERRPADESGVAPLDLTRALAAITGPLGFSVQWFDDSQLASGQLSAVESPVLMVVDEREELPLSVRAPGDGLQALTAYARSGGAIVLMPAGIPFYHGREWTGDRWTVRPLRQLVVNALGFQYLMPGAWREDVQAFEIPDNHGATLIFERATSAEPWDTLPERLVFPLVADSRFRPILPLEGDTPAEVETIYQLRSDQGEHFGTAMAAIRHPSGDLAACRLYHIAPTLAAASLETGEPALSRLLPAVLTHALTTRTSDDPPTATATQP